MRQAAAENGAGGLLHPIYYTDEYPREGCSIGIDVATSGICLRVYAPNGRQLEAYAPKSADAAAAIVLAWLRGEVPPRNYNELTVQVSS